MVCRERHPDRRTKGRAEKTDLSRKILVEAIFDNSYCRSIVRHNRPARILSVKVKSSRYARLFPPSTHNSVNMEISDSKYESIKSRLRKLHLYVAGGSENEARNARLAIERLCSQYGLTIEEVLSDEQEKRWFKFEVGRSSVMLELFAQCHGVVTGDSTLRYCKTRKISVIEVQLTPMQGAELSNLFTWHQANFKRELKNMQSSLMDAYIHKHHLFRAATNDDAGTDRKKDLTPEEIERIKKMLHLSQTLSDSHYHKMIE